MAEAGIDANQAPGVIKFCVRTGDQDEVEYATLEWVEWFNNRRLLEPIGNIPPAEYEK